MIEATVLWRRLDVPGHDACWLESTASGWLIRGAAVFLDAAGPAQLAYEAECSRDWSTLRGSVHGSLGESPIDLTVTRTAPGTWGLNGNEVPGLAHCLDLDLGFTPATNLSQLRRLALGVGEVADVPVAWLDTDSLDLTELVQRYERRSESTYWYEAPRFDYAAMLDVTSDGFVRTYPGLWQAESA